MKVKLISCSQALPFEGKAVPPNLKELIAYMARVSNPGNQYNDNYHSLVEYLQKHRHWSPFEMVSVAMEITTTRDIARQILRHRSFSFQEFSQRYAEVPLELVVREARMQDLKNRQNSLECGYEDISKAWIAKQLTVAQEAKHAYEWALKQGIAKEVARCVLPEGMTPTTLYMHGTIRSWLHYLSIRIEKGTQLEHQLLAKNIKSALETVYKI